MPIGHSFGAWWLQGLVHGSEAVELGLLLGCAASIWASILNPTSSSALLARLFALLRQAELLRCTW